MKDLNEVLEQKRQALFKLEDEIDALETVAELLLDEKDQAFRNAARASYPMPTAADVKQQAEDLHREMAGHVFRDGFTTADRGPENVVELNSAEGVVKVTKVTVKDEPPTHRYDLAHFAAKLPTKEEQAAMDAHLSDLRVLLDHAAKREERLLNMVENGMQPNATRPVITSSRPAPENKIGPIVPLESLSDQPSFDEGEDQRQVASSEDAMKELLSIAAEHREAHAKN